MPQEMDGKTLDLRRESIKKLKDLFPEVVTDGERIDFDELRRILAAEVDDRPERYNFTWNGKKEAMRLANVPSMGTLRPNKAKSKDWDTTENLYIEGDNLEVLKLLQKSYAGKIKVIYIDPPYNTGKDFVYADSFKDGVANYLEQTEQLSQEGNKLSTNSELNGRFHTDWLNMMYPRLKLARNLLSDDGVIFISIDDNEDANLKKIADEIFGEDNFLAKVIWERAFSPINLKKNFSESHDYILVYAKDSSDIETKGLKRTEGANDRYNNPDNDPRGPWSSSDLSVGPAVESNIYEITTPSGRKVLPPSGYSWRLDQKKFKEYVSDNRIWFGEDGNNVPRIKRFLSEVKQTLVPMTIWKHPDVGHSQGASQALKKLFNGKAYFTYPKPVELIKRTLELYSDENSIILDFFSGSATTAHATMQLNAEDKGNRKFIMVQLPEPLEEKSEAYKDGYRTICDIGEERIRRAGEKIRHELTEKADNENVRLNSFDFGFKVLTLDTSNIRRWNKNTDNLEEEFDLVADNFIEGRTDDDIIYEILLKQGIELSVPIEKEIISGSSLYTIAQGALYVVLGDNITRNVAEYVIRNNGFITNDLSSIVFQDNGFINDSEKLNSFEILTQAGFQSENIFTI